MKFLIRFGVLIGAWYFLYKFLIKPSRIYDELIIDTLTKASAYTLNLFGFETFLVDVYSRDFFNLIHLSDSQGVMVGPECDGLVVISLFVFFIIAFPGAWKKKLWYIPAGAFFLMLLNIIRISILAYLVKYSPEWLEFNHDYTFTLMIYGVVFLLWYVWVNKLSKN